MVATVTAGLAESDGSLPPRFVTPDTLAHCQEPGSAPGPIIVYMPGCLYLVLLRLCVLSENEGSWPVRDDCAAAAGVGRSSTTGRTEHMCRVNRSMLGRCDGRHDRDFGYSSAQPCVLLKLNRVRHRAPRFIALSYNSKNELA